MGLDQYAHKINKKSKKLFEKSQKGLIDCFLTEQISLDCDTSEIMYWRKHPNLQQWVIDRLGLEQDFNGSDFAYLEKDDIDALEQDVINDNLPCGEGFFWGVSHKEHKAKDLEFIIEAKKALKEGFLVCYSCSW